MLYKYNSCLWAQIVLDSDSHQHKKLLTCLGFCGVYLFIAALMN